MSWAIGFDDKWARDVGYGVPAFCDHHGCDEKIDRGLSYVCGGEPYGGERGCGLYFCSAHLFHHQFRGIKNGAFFCKRCITYRPPYKPKPEHPEWLEHKATDPSWEEWRKEQRIAMMQNHIEKALAAPAWHTRPVWSKFLRLSVPTYIENWPSELCRLSIAQVDIPLTIPEATALGTNIIELGEGFGTPADIRDIERRLDDAVAIFPAGAFVRLGSRSPKDAFYADLSKPVKSGKEALAWLLGGSGRIADDLHLAISNDYAPHIFVRQWMDLEPWQEFRCFMNGCRLVGISQYYYRQHEPKVELYKDSIKWAIEQHFFPEFRDSTPLQSVVFDVFVRVRERERERETQVKLLEINPFFEMTDPCLFDWRKPDMFDGRMLTAEK